jgi:hypothetical protein
MVQLDEGFGDGVLAPALCIALSRAEEQAVEGAQQVGHEVAKGQFGGELGGLGHHQIDAIGQRLAQGSGGFFAGGLAKESQALDLRFDATVCHRLSYVQLINSYGQLINQPPFTLMVWPVM